MSESKKPIPRRKSELLGAGKGILAGAVVGGFHTGVNNLMDAQEGIPQPTPMVSYMPPSVSNPAVDERSVVNEIPPAGEENLFDKPYQGQNVQAAAATSDENKQQDGAPSETAKKIVDQAATRGILERAGDKVVSGLAQAGTYIPDWATGSPNALGRFAPPMLIGAAAGAVVTRRRNRDVQGTRDEAAGFLKKLHSKIPSGRKADQVAESRRQNNEEPAI
jgi:hypothetical protein